MILFRKKWTLFLIFSGFLILDIASLKIKIYPTTRDSVVTPPRDMSLGCEGDGILENITWSVPDNSDFFTNTNFERRVRNEKQEEEALPKLRTRSPDQINIIYSNITDEDDESKINAAALLVLTNVTYEDVGNYVCHVVGASIDDEENSKKIFVFVKDQKRLAFLEKDKYYTINHQDRTQNVTFPCIPTGPNTTVILKASSSSKNSESYTEISSEIATYSSREGYTLKIIETHFDKFICEFVENKTTEVLYFNVRFDNFLEYNLKPYINSSDFIYKKSRGSLKLYCAIAKDSKNTSSLVWVIPNKSLKVEDIVTNVTIPIRNGHLQALILNIKDLTEKDAGEYACKLNDTEINSHVAKTFVTIDLDEFPHVKPVINATDIYKIKSGDNLILSCGGNEKLKWSLPSYAEQNSTFVNTKRDPSDKSASKFKHVTYLKITNASYFYTGKYYCHQENSQKNNPDFATEIFVYVEDEKHLNSYPNELINILAAQYSNITIPCIPTSPDVKVSLIDTLTSQERPEKYVPYKGFTLYLPVDDIIDNLQCTFQKGNQIETQKIRIDLQRTYKYAFMPFMSNANEVHSFIGGNLTLYCTVIVKPNFTPNISWSTPDHPEFLTNRTFLNISEVSYMVSNGKLVVSTLTINNVELGDFREYECSILDDKNKTQYERKSFNLNIEFNLKPVINTPRQIAVGDTLEANCTVRVDHNIRFTIKWETPGDLEDNRTTVTESKYYRDVFGTLGNRTLIIKNVTYDDTGNYTCNIRDHKNNTNNETLIITIKDPTYPQILESNLKNITTVIKAGTPYDMHCKIEKSDIPEPTIRWYKDNELIVNNGSEEISYFYTQVIDSGFYSCNVTNRLGMISNWVYLQVEGEASPLGLQILGGVIGILGCGFIIVMFIFIRRWIRERKFQRKLESVGLVDITKGQISNLNPNICISDQAELLPYDTKWEIPRDRIKIGAQLGSGEFGIVMQGEVFCVFVGETIKTVAVKMLRRNPDYHSIKALVNELKIMTYIGKHVNVVNLLGACTTNIKKREIFIITEYCLHGSLLSILRDHRESFINQIDPETGLIDIDNINPDLYKIPIPSEEQLAKYMNPYKNLDNSEKPKKLCKEDYKKSRKYVNVKRKEEKQKYVSTHDLLCWSFQVGRAMEYLSSRKILHGDLAARNVLLSDSNIVKICDFGLAKNMYKYKNYKKKRNIPLPVKWMAIESIRDRVFSTESDVWSFGVTLWEFFTLARTPYAEVPNDDQFLKKLENGLRMEQPEYATSDIYHIMKKCWEEEPADRPTFPTLVELLGSMVHETVRKHYIELNKPYEKLNISEKSPDYVSKQKIESPENVITDGTTEELNGEKIENNENNKKTNEESDETNESSEMEESELTENSSDSQIRKRFKSIVDVEVHHPLA